MPKFVETTFGGEHVDTEALREVLEGDDGNEMSYRRGYQQGANEAFSAVKAFLAPAQTTPMSKWIAKLGTARRSATELPRAPTFTGGK
jgi:hypothetical protein